MKAVCTLPEGYAEICAIDLQKNKKLMLLVNLIAVLIGLVMAVPMHFYIPITTLFDMQAGLGAYTARFAVLLVLLVVYMIYTNWCTALL